MILEILSPTIENARIETLIISRIIGTDQFLHCRANPSVDAEFSLVVDTDFVSLDVAVALFGSVRRHRDDNILRNATSRFGIGR